MCCSNTPPRANYGTNLTTEITALYLAKFRLPTSGYQVALKLIGVSADGPRTPPLLVTAIAQPLIATLANTPTQICYTQPSTPTPHSHCQMAARKGHL